MTGLVNRCTSLYEHPHVSIRFESGVEIKEDRLVHRGPFRVTIQTERLTLRSVTLEDEQFYAEKLWGNHEVMRLYADGTIRDPTYVAQRVNGWVKRWQEGNPYSALVVYKATERIGHIIIGHGDHPGESEAATLFVPEQWRRGYGKEAGQAIKAYAMVLRKEGFLLGGAPLQRIVATARGENIASVRIMEGLGAQCVKKEVKFGAMRMLYQLEFHTPRQTSALMRLWSAFVHSSRRLYSWLTHHLWSGIQRWRHS